jgi:hypothetical protein
MDWLFRKFVAEQALGERPQANNDEPEERAHDKQER